MSSNNKRQRWTYNLLLNRVIQDIEECADLGTARKNLAEACKDFILCEAIWVEAMRCVPDCSNFIVTKWIIRNGIVIEPVNSLHKHWKLDHAKRKDDASSEKNQDAWLIRCSFFIPKRFREAWLGDLLEDRKEMRSRGETRLRIELATASQLLNIAFANPKLWFISLGVWLISKVRNWFA